MTEPEWEPEHENSLQGLPVVGPLLARRKVGRVEFTEENGVYEVAR